MQKPIIFLDFDYTLFDTDQIYDWLGADIKERIAQFVDGEIAGPDFSKMLYSDTRDFLKNIQETHHSVLLTYADNVAFQEKKVDGSGVKAYVNDVLIVPGMRGEGGKGREAKNYLLRSQHPVDGRIFVDDAPENILEVKKANPEMACIRMARRSSVGGVPVVDIQKPDAVVSDLAELASVLGTLPLQSSKGSY